jgi:hypothetical protein
VFTKNLSKYSDFLTAHTDPECAAQRAENLSILGVKTVLELCVGPSLRDLELAYSKVGIKVTGNDIDERWLRFYPKGSWILGDATTVDRSGFDAVVIAPPLSRGCSGRREDSLSLDEVTPSYYSFLPVRNKITTFVLPGRTLSVKSDREQLFRFLSRLEGKLEIVPLKKKVVKYLDVYLIRS